MFDSNFQASSLAGNFDAPNVPAGLMPFNVKRVGGRIFVTRCRRRWWSRRRGC